MGTFGLVVFMVILGSFCIFFRFLALLDYARRGHEIEIRPSVCGIDYL